MVFFLFRIIFPERVPHGQWAFGLRDVLAHCVVQCRPVDHGHHAHAQIEPLRCENYEAQETEQDAGVAARDKAASCGRRTLRFEVEMRTV